MARTSIPGILALHGLARYGSYKACSEAEGVSPNLLKSAVKRLEFEIGHKLTTTRAGKGTEVTETALDLIRVLQNCNPNV